VPRIEISHRRVLSIAVPIMLSNLSTPLLGIVDTAVMGRLPDPAHIGAVALGSLIFTFVFWAFGFLRMGTTGLTAQALGAGDAVEVRSSLGRAAVVALAMGVVLLLLQVPIRFVAFRLIDGSEQVEGLARTYFDLRIWAAPATLLNYALLGWFIGLGRAKTALALQLVLNVVNASLDLLFVIGFGWGVAGVAAGTALAEGVAAVAGLALAARVLQQIGGRWERGSIFDRARLTRTLAVNRDIMVRSMALMFVFIWFMARGAAQGDRILAANAVLMHLVSSAAYFLDGLAFAAEALVGRAVGAADRAMLWAAAKVSTGWAAAIACALSLAYLAFGGGFIDWLTVDAGTRAVAKQHLGWAVAAPIAGVWAFQLDGIFIGATRTVQMRDAMVFSLGIFLLGWWLLLPLGNHGLWASLFIHYMARTLTLGRHAPALFRGA
jgi:MATE family multidrug resistance protein